MFYDIFVQLCEENGISPTRVLTQLDISKGSLSRWKDGGEPLNETKKKIADYFGITISELMAGKIKTAPTKVEADDEMAEILEAARHDPDMKMLFSLSKKANKEDLKKAIKIIKMITGNDNGEYND